MKTNSLVLSAMDYPELARLYPGQEVELEVKATLRMKHLENTEEYVELNVVEVEVEEKERMSVQEILLAQIASGTQQQPRV
jgi:hypothetical protein